MAEEVTLDEIEVVAGDAKVDVTNPSTANPNAGNTTDTPPNGPQEQTSQTLNTLSNGDLPWAKVLLPTTSAGQGGIGEGRHGLQPETWVYGIFLDGDACQQPLVLGVISGGPGAGSGRGGNGDGGGTGTTGGSSSSVGPGTSSIGGDGKLANTGGDNAERAYKYLIRQGYSPQNAAGILGNLVNEGAKGGGDLDPNIHQIGGGGGYGIAQWTDRSRKDGLRRYAGDKYNTLEGQLSFLVHELKTKEVVAERLLQNARNSVKDSALAFANFERPKGHSQAFARKTGGQGLPPWHEKAIRRIRSAEAIYAKMQGKTFSSEVNKATTTKTVGPAKVNTAAPASSGQFALTGVVGK